MSKLTYDRQKAVSYADLWWNKPNPQYIYFGDEDCTNYVSQCLFAGGVPMQYGRDRNAGWWYRFSSPPSYSYSWAVAHSLKVFLETSISGVKGVPVEHPQQLEVGDVICYDFDGDGRWQHNALVVDFNMKGEPLINTHSYNRTHAHWALKDSPAHSVETKYLFFHLVI
ncbi:amidase domain-containing protein [Thermicanus aegyptius]|uniref:amidase domain-containing protein n=1 Tax=Thermicanus aegyptius TaxID=94009 RepID=UPI00146FB644|nr:amidase domain-containing protein [Thermicanus aegyptius]